MKEPRRALRMSDTPPSHDPIEMTVADTASAAPTLAPVPKIH